MAQHDSQLWLLDFNNYYNRTIKSYSNAIDYYDNHFIMSTGPCNFNPADGIDTEHVFNIPTLQTPPPANYVLVVSPEHEIKSRWFIVNATRLRGGQYKLTLHRDLVAEFKEAIIKAPCYVERAMLNIASNYIFNPEGGTYNQIKTKEERLYDTSGCGWYVGYVASDTVSTTVTVPTDTAVTYPAPPIDYATLTGYSGDLVKIPDNYILRVYGTVGGRYINRNVAINTAGYIESYGDTTYKGTNPFPSNLLFDQYRTAEQDAKDFLKGVLLEVDTVRNALLTDFQGELSANGKGGHWVSSDILDGILAMDGGTYFDIASNKIFRVSAKYKSREGSYTYKRVQKDTVAYNTLIPIAKDSMKLQMGGSGSLGLDFRYDADSLRYEIKITDITAQSGIQATIAPTTIGLQDAPYKMFAIPAGAVTVGFDGGDTTTYTSNSTYNRHFACLAAIKLNAQLYDLQYMPYCPIRTKWEDGKLMLSGTAATATDTTITLLKKDSTVYSYMLWADRSNFEFVINKTIEVPSDATQFKIANETKFCRLVSPNFNGAFEFKPTSNRGILSFNVSCTYKPFQPYIKVQPVYKDGKNTSLYGGAFDDNRGLICGGDFSLPIVTDNWISFQLQNASYKESFNRQIENMETSFGIQYQQQKISGQLGVLQAGLSGFGLGAMGTGMVPGVGLGASLGVGAVTGLAGAAGSYAALQKDLQFTKMAHREALDYAKDQFGYQLQNIKALPYTLSKVSAISQDFKEVPFIEYYEATTDEELALEEKIKYRGMAVGVISTFEEFLQEDPTFIQGSLIRLEGLAEDYHLLTAIAQELHEGVYMTK